MTTTEESLESKLPITILQPEDPAYERCLQRLKEDLDLDEEALEVIIHLRNQLARLRGRLQTLETEVQVYRSSSGSRLTRYRQVVYDAEWEEEEQE